MRLRGRERRRLTLIHHSSFDAAVTEMVTPALEDDAWQGVL